MFTHNKVGSNDIDRSRRFYDAVLGTLGVPVPFPDQAGTGHKRLFLPAGTRCFAPQQVKNAHEVEP